VFPRITVAVSLNDTPLTCTVVSVEVEDDSSELLDSIELDSSSDEEAPVDELVPSTHATKDNPKTNVSTARPFLKF